MTNIAELLKDAPKGMKLYSPLFGKVEFSKINSVNRVEVIVTCTDGTQGIERFHSNGTYISRCPDAECLLFPSKDCRTWEGWKLPVEPKFKVGDKISWINHDCDTQTITDIRDDSYITVDKYGVRCALKFVNQDKWELVPKPHYDINNFKPFDKVLVRYDNTENWKCGLFSHISTSKEYKFVCVGATYCQCIPYEGNEHLLGTTDMCPEEYINW